MVYLTEHEANEMLESAKQACEHTYSPYSKFVVGAAALTKDGRIFTGTNVENASYGLALCAERVAIANAIAAGARHIKAIAVHGTVDSIAPCGACRQFIIEFGADIIVLFKENGEIIEKRVGELLPFHFRLPG